jgi:protein SCO1/2/putative membrane protein
MTEHRARRGLPLLLAAVLATGLLGGLVACGSDADASGGGIPRLDADADDPVEFGAVPDFALVSQLGERVTLADLRGRPFVLAPVYTTCAGPCPTISANMRGLQQQLLGTDALLVSVTLDPRRDDAESLGAYARSYEADPERWLFLTGGEAEIDSLVKDGLKLAVERAAPGEAIVGQQVSHSSRLVAVDRSGRIRGWYAGDDEASVERLRARMQALAREER